MALDIHISWFNAHGGAFHKLISLHTALTNAGVRCVLDFACGPPRGLKAGVDVPEALLPQLAAAGVRLMPRAEALERARTTTAQLFVTDAHHDQDIPKLLAGLQARGVETAQLATLLGDFTDHGARHLLVQHPLTLFFELEYNRTRESARLAEAARVYFTGNLFFDPSVNELHGGYADRAAFCARYGFQPDRPICLWLPSAPDTRDSVYGEVCEAVEAAGMNLAIKLHPWEYAFRKHGAEGVDPWKLGKCSDELWNRRAVDERDGTWAFRFCDVAILRASAMCLEMPFWEKPSLLLPSNIMPRLFESQAYLVRHCALPVPTTAALAALLRSGSLPAFTPAEYKTGCDSVRLPGPGNGLERTVSALLHILTGAQGAALPPFLEPKGSLDRLRASYDGLIGPQNARALLLRRRVRFEAGRLWRRLRGVR